MPTVCLKIRILVASPSDCEDERRIVQEISYKWNQAHTFSSNVIVEPVLWESHAYPDIGKRPQQIINERLVDTSDILVGIFWTRIGTSTGAEVSGTAEEIKRFISSGKKVMLYFSKKPIDPDSIDFYQYESLKEFKSSLADRGLYFNFTHLPQFESMFSQHLSMALGDLLSEESYSDENRLPMRKYSDAESDLVALVFELVDVWAKYSQSPPTVELSDYRASEDALKHHIYKFRLELGKEISEQAEYIAVKMRSFLEIGNEMATLFGGDGRVDSKTLNSQRNELGNMARAC